MTYKPLSNAELHCEEPPFEHMREQCLKANDLARVASALVKEWDFHRNPYPEDIWSSLELSLITKLKKYRGE